MRGILGKTTVNKLIYLSVFPSIFTCFVRTEIRKKRVLILSGYLPRIYGGKNTGVISKGKNSEGCHNFNKGLSRFLITTK